MLVVNGFHWHQVQLQIGLLGELVTLHIKPAENHAIAGDHGSIICHILDASDALTGYRHLL